MNGNEHAESADVAFGAAPIPLIDISAWRSGSEESRREIAHKVDMACRQIGFLVVQGHSVPRDVIARFENATREFFALPLEAKLQFVSEDSSLFRGYMQINAAALTRAYSDEKAAPDFRETFSIVPAFYDEQEAYFNSEMGRRFFASNIWPDVVEGFQSAWEDYYHAMERQAAELMQIFAVALGLEEDFFADKIDKHITNMLASYYPRPTEDSIRSLVRAGAHTDYGTLTILRAEDKPGGLQVRCADGTWRDVRIIPETFVINIGDMMAQWTNDIWTSTIHRVVNPPLDKVDGSDRLSIAFFHQPNYDAIVECLPSCLGSEGAKYGPVTSGEYLERKLEQIRTPNASAA